MDSSITKYQSTKSLIKDCKKVKAVHIHQFSDASEIACSTVSIAVIDRDTDKVMGLLTSKCRIAKRNTSMPRLELIGGHMSANMISNLRRALKGLPVVSITSWMVNTSVLYWIINPGKQRKTSVSNRVSKIAKITEEHQIDWKYCPSEMNIADLGTKGASLDKMERGNWYEGPKWLLNESDWSNQPVLKSTSQVNEEAKKATDVIAYTSERKPDEWDNLLDRKTYWKTLTIASWILQFINNCKAKAKNEKGTVCPL